MKKINKIKFKAYFARDLARPVPVVVRPCQPISIPKPQKSKELARPVPVATRPCATPRHL